MDRIQRYMVGALLAAAFMLSMVLLDRVELQAQVDMCVAMAPAVTEMVETRARVAGELETLTASLRAMLERDPAEWRRDELLVLEAAAGQIRRGL